MHFGVLLNKTISEWQGQNFPCYNKMNRNGARTVADQIVMPEDMETYAFVKLSCQTNKKCIKA